MPYVAASGCRRRHRCGVRVGARRRHARARARLPGTSIHVHTRVYALYTTRFASRRPPRAPRPRRPTRRHAVRLHFRLPAAAAASAVPALRPNGRSPASNGWTG